MKDLKLVTDTSAADYHDLDITNYDLSLVDELDYVRQKIEIKLQFFFGEWFLDTTKGVKYFELILIKNPDLTTIASIIKTAILDTDNVTELLEYEQSYSASARELTISFRAQTEFGEIENTIVTGV